MAKAGKNTPKIGKDEQKAKELAYAARDELVAKLNLSTAQPERVDIEGTETPIQDIAFAAYVDSGLKIDDWNKLTDEDRQARIVRVIDLLRAQAIEDAEDAARGSGKRKKAGGGRAVLVVATKRRGSTRRRAGFAFTDEPQDLNAADLSEAVIAELEGDPDLVTSRQERD